MKDYYELLNVAPTASQETIREQYRFLIQAWHPDKFSNAAQKAKAEEITKELNSAYEVLKNPQKRARYDSERTGQASRYREEQSEQQAEEQRQRKQAEETQRRAKNARQQREQAKEENRRTKFEQEQKRSEEQRLRKEAEEGSKRKPFEIYATILLVIVVFAFLFLAAFGGFLNLPLRSTNNTQQATLAKITPTPTPKPTTVPVVLYSDDFSNSQSGWLESSNDFGKFQYSGGEYVISRPQGNFYTYSCANHSFTDAVLTVDAKILLDASETGLVVVWRYIDANNFYALQIDRNSSYTILRLLNNEWHIFNNDKVYYIQGIHGGEAIQIAISFYGATSTIYINNLYVTSVIDTAFTSGDACLGAFSSEWSAVEVSFDNLVIYTVDSWTPPK